MAPNYATRDELKAALDAKESAFINQQIDTALDAASRSVERLCHRVFYPQTATRYFPWEYGSLPWRLELNDSELIALTSFTSGSTSILPSKLFLEPNRSGPPFTRIEVDRDVLGSFEYDGLEQRDFAITGVWGYDLDDRLIGTVTEALDATETDVDVSAAASVVAGVGASLLVDAERMLVTAAQMVSTGLTVGGVGLSAQNNSQGLTVASGASFATGQTLLIDQERLQVLDIAGNVLTVKRGHAGTTLAAHTAGTTIYSPLTVTVQRGAQGTTAAAHSINAPLFRNYAPAPIRSLVIAEALNQVAQEQSAYGRVVGSGDAQREARGVGLAGARSEVYDKYARKGRMRGV